jgi:glycosyltransferase involved in cell wall biosynthesis
MGGILYQSGLSNAAASLSVVLITLNEEENLSALFPDIPKGAEIIVVDSGSQDQTNKIATSYGAYVEVRPFDHYANQKNHALSLAKRSWTLLLDADERPDCELWSEILAAVANNQTKAYRLSRRLVFAGHKMGYGRTKDSVVRLFPTGSAFYKHEIHESVCFKSCLREAELKGVLWHFSYKNLSDYFVKFNRYTTLVAQARISAGASLPSRQLLALRLPVDFVMRYIMRGGFLDGWQGFLWAVLGSFYGFVKYAKALEIKAQARQ